MIIPMTLSVPLGGVYHHDVAVTYDSSDRSRPWVAAIHHPAGNGIQARGTTIEDAVSSLLAFAPSSYEGAPRRATWTDVARWMGVGTVLGTGRDSILGKHLGDALWRAGVAGAPLLVSPSPVGLSVSSGLGRTFTSLDPAETAQIVAALAYGHQHGEDVRHLVQEG